MHFPPQVSLLHKLDSKHTTCIKCQKISSNLSLCIEVTFKKEFRHTTFKI